MRAAREKKFTRSDSALFRDVTFCKSVKLTFVGDEHLVDDVHHSVGRHDVRGEHLRVVDENTVRVARHAEERVLKRLHSLRVLADGGTARHTVDDVVAEHVYSTAAVQSVKPSCKK